jgi:hypothetical protein
MAASPVAAEQTKSSDPVVVPVDDINKVSVAAIDVARGMSDKVIATYITDDPDQAEQFRERWRGEMPDVPLMVIESPYRAFVVPLLAYVESLEDADPDSTVTVVLPRFVTTKWWEPMLHNQDILRLKSYLSKRNKETRVIELPYRLGEELPAGT